MKSRYIKMILKVISFVVCFLLIFVLLQDLFVSITPSPDPAVGFYKLRDESIDVLFLGPSQMFSTVDAQKLLEEYGITSYDFGAAGQRLPISYYYLQEALKSQHPKIVAVEVAQLFAPSEPSDEMIAWNYSLMPLSVEKYNSLVEFFDGDRGEAIRCCIPLLCYHSMWNQFNPISQIKKMIENAGKEYSSRGFIGLEEVEKVNIEYLSDDSGEVGTVREKTIDAVLNIAELCEQNGIRLMFFKAPTADWSRSESAVFKELMEEHHFTYLEMNDYLDEIGIDPDTDFANTNHLNTSGADKTTDFIANYLIETFGLS